MGNTIEVNVPAPYICETGDSKNVSAYDQLITDSSKSLFGACLREIDDQFSSYIETGMKREEIDSIRDQQIKAAAALSLKNFDWENVDKELGLKGES